jgi:hypothetical protein
MALWEVFRFLRAARRLAPLDREAVKAAGVEGEKHETYHRQIILMGGGCAVLGLLSSGFLLQALVREAGGRIEGHGWMAVITVPLLMAMAGFCLGVGVACLFAPTSFLAGPLGRKWMNFIGTRSVPLARLVCLLIALVLGVAPLAAGLIVVLTR